MSMPNIPDIKPDIDIDRDKSIDLLIASVALEELSLAHIVNAEAEKIQFVLGTLHKDDDKHDRKEPTMEELMEINKSVEQMLKIAVEKEILLDFMLEDAIKLMKLKDKDKYN